MAKWISLFKFSWLRKCKVCRVRGTKCLCKRPSLALEHIFFLEERKNKFGARNFSHVSDTMVTSSTRNNSLTNGNNTNNTVFMRGSSFGDEYAFVDYYYNPSQRNSITNSTSSAVHQQQQPPRGSGSRGSHSSGGRGSHSSRTSLDKKRSAVSQRTAAPPLATTTTIVRKHSGRMLVPSSAARRRFEELPNDYTLYSDHTTSSIAPSSNSRRRRQPLQLQNGSSSSDQDDDSSKRSGGCSYKFYGRNGQHSSVSTSASTFNSSRGPLNSGRGFGSKNDTLILSSSRTSSLRLSTVSASDRMSVDNNFGSYNPRTNGLLLENGNYYAGGSASIQEDAADDDSDALQQLNGWLHASPTSTAGSFAAPRNVHCF